MKTPWQRRDERGADLDDEIRAHIEMAVRDRMARGESREAAMAAVRREFGNVGHVKEITRDMWGTGGLWLERFVQDLRYAVRSMRRAPAFTVVAVLTLALGIGANTAMFTVMHGVLFRPLPFPNQERLYAPSFKAPDGIFSPYPGLYDKHYLAVESDTTIFASIVTYGSEGLTLTGVGDPVKVLTTPATAGFFATLGVFPAIGRAFSASDASDGAADVAIISDAMWRARFGGDQRIVGSVITLDGKRRTVIGVMPATFDFPSGTSFWIPLAVHTDAHNTRMRRVIARLRADVPSDQAFARFSAITARLEPMRGLHPEQFKPELQPLKSVIVGDATRPLMIFAGAIVFVLLIACANVANLLLMRVSTREREIAVRTALGAGRWRLVRQMLTETLTISAAGAVIGVGFAVLAVHLLLALAPDGTIPRTDSVKLDATALAFTAGVTLFTALLCGLVPALHATEHRLYRALTSGARTIAGGHNRIRSLLVVGEIALALVLLTGAGLLLRSFERMRSVQLGFDPSNVFAVTVDLPPASYKTPADMRDFHQRVVSSLSAIPGVVGAGAVNWIPLGKGLIKGDFKLEDGRPLPNGYSADKIAVTPGYLRSMGIRVERGRDFAPADGPAGPAVAIITHSVAARLWPAGDAVGKRISNSDNPTPADWITIVGIANDVIQSDVTDEPHGAIYQPVAQMANAFFLGHVTYVVKRAPGAANIPQAMRRVLQEADPNLALEQLSSVDERVEWTTLTPRFQSRMLLAFSLIALTLAMIGIYGVLAYGVAQRLHEIGVRVALGAGPGQVMSIVLWRTIFLIAPGLVLGGLASLGLTRVLAKFLFQVTPTDPVTFAAVGSLLLAVALAAAYLPARRASRVDPIVALRPD